MKRTQYKHFNPWWLVLTACLVLTFPGCSQRPDHILWSMVHVSGEAHSGDAHLLEFPDGRVVLIDTGFDRYTRSSLLPYLQQRGIDRIDDLIVTHAHRNHYGGTGSLLKHLKQIKRVHFNLPPKKPCEKETWSTGCNYSHVLETHKGIKESGSALITLKAGQILYQDKDAEIDLKVLYVHDGVSPPIGETDINDTSALLHLRYGKTSILFAADVNRKVGNYLAKNVELPRSTILTAPHHGVESAAANTFLDKINAKVLMVSNSARHWLGKRGERMRQYATQRDIPVYVTGLHGNVVVTLKADGFSVATDEKR